MFLLKSKLYLIYNVFQSADFIQIDDMPPVIPYMSDIKDDPTNIVVTLPYDKYYQINDVTFMEEDLSEASTGAEFYTCIDSTGNKRKIKFLKLTNMLQLKKTT
tara:strand:- start:522 stop:830 length:309 start_codon:yes stop_codon:yes gene_type:complete